MLSPITTSVVQNDEPSVSAKVLIGADGNQSAVRKQCLGEESCAEYMVRLPGAFMLEHVDLFTSHETGACAWIARS